VSISAVQRFGRQSLDSEVVEDMKTMNGARIAAMSLVMVVAGMFLFPANRVAAQGDEVAQAIKSKLKGKQYSNVVVNVDQNGVARLTGTVELFEYKADADRLAHKVKGVKAVEDDIQVGGGSASDEEIQKKLGPALAYSREGYGNLFDAVIMNVQNGVVTLSGHTHDYANRDAAVGLASTTPGVKEVIDNIEVDPASPMDDNIRMQVARAIYGYPALNKYAINPVRPIRITVQNGHVQLYGMVDNDMDRTLAFTQARQVPGIFSVDNYIQVAGKVNEQQDNVPSMHGNQTGNMKKNPQNNQKMQNDQQKK
jgi:hyperosmotically inducible periplasmic protein